MGKIWSWRGTKLLLVVPVLALWALVLAQVEGSVFGRVPILDEVYYLDRAEEIAAGEMRSSDPYFMSPLYPVLATLTGAGGGVPEDRVFDGTELRGLRLFHIACWLATAVMINLLARRLVPRSWTASERRWAQFLPVVFFVTYLPAVVYSMAILLELPLLFLITLTALLTVEVCRRPLSLSLLIGLGVVIGLAALLRGTALLLLPVVVGAVARQKKLRLARSMAAVTVGVLLVLAWPTIHNTKIAGRLAGPTMNGGVNFYIGNGPEANGFYVATVPGDWRDDPAGRDFLAQRLGRDDVSLAEADAIWSAETWRQVKAQPARALKLVGYKIWLQLQGWEIDQLTPLGGWAGQVPALRLLVTPYFLFVVLGVAGISGLERRSAGWWLVALLVTLVLGQSLFFIVSRYRLILVPFWAVLAGLGVVQLVRRRRVTWLLATLALLVTVPWGLNEVRRDWGALAQANEALRWADLGVADDNPVALRRAESLFRQSLAVVDDRPASWLGLSAVLTELGRADEMRETLREGIAKASRPMELQKAALAQELARQNWGPAWQLAEAILRTAPRDAETLHNAAVLLARLDRPNEALSHARRLTDFFPSVAQGYIDWGVLLARSGRIDEAEEVFRKGLRQCPDDPDLLHNLGRVKKRR